MHRAVFLDRDNTIIHNDGDLGDPAQVRLIRGSAHAIASLRDLGYRIIVVSNQGGVARGLYTEEDVEAVHDRISQLVNESDRALIDRFYFCPYHPAGTVSAYAREHHWRKPSPGMIEQAARDFDLRLDECWMIGDQSRDAEAGRRAGCRTILIDRTGSAGPCEHADFRVSTIAEAAQIVAQFRTRNQIRPQAIIVEPRPSPVQPTAERTVAQPVPAVARAATVEAPQSTENAEGDDSLFPRDSAAPPVEDRHTGTPAATDSGRAEESTSADEADHRPEIHIAPISPRRAPDRDRVLTDLVNEVRALREARSTFGPDALLSIIVLTVVLLAGLAAALYAAPERAAWWVALAALVQSTVVGFVVLGKR